MSTDNDASGNTPPYRFDRLYRFPGGLVLPGHKGMSTVHPVLDAGIPPLLILPLQQHIGDPADCLVSPGEYVPAGMKIAQSRGRISATVHASSSGMVVAIEDHVIPHPSGLTAPCIIIETDGKDTWQERDYRIDDYRQTEPVKLLEHIRKSGIVGLGGAGFPTQVKLNSRLHNGIDLLIINGAECEPYISCDNMLLRERAAEVIKGARILQHILQARQCVIAVEEDMQGAATALRKAIESLEVQDIPVIKVPEIYPTGGERQLIRVLTGLEVPSQGYPYEIGIICQNVGTVAAIYRAVIKNRPLTSRIVTVSGTGVVHPRNIEARIGTPVSHAIGVCGGYSGDVDRLLVGGPMMGFALNSDEVPVIKTTNCLLAVSRKEIPPPSPARPCIRCGKCTDVCPADLLPQQLYWYARSNDYDKAQDYNLFDCIECGCCAHVCPSHIPLVQYYRYAKTEIWEQEKQTRKADIARLRHQAREERLARLKRERAERLGRKKKTLAAEGASPGKPGQAAIQAALERVRKKKEQMDISPRNVDNLSPEQQELIRQADKRRRERRPRNEAAEQ